MILLIDNYDSYVHNLARYFRRLGQQTIVRRNDDVDANLVDALSPGAIVVSPGPRAPSDAGCSVEMIRRFAARVPILGVCLGHQAIAAAFGGRVVRSGEPMHGRTSEIFHSGEGIFAGIQNPLVACRYHSLIVEEPSLPDCLEVTACTADGTVMAIQHREQPVVGVQFHPESILTEKGYDLLANFLVLAELELPESQPSFTDELQAAGNEIDKSPARAAPITF